MEAAPSHLQCVAAGSTTDGTPLAKAALLRKGLEGEQLHRFSEMQHKEMQ